MSARFLNDAHRHTYKSVARMMVGLFGDNVEASLELTELSVGLGTARADVRVMPWQDDALVIVSSTLLRQTAVDFDLMEFLLQENAAMDIGSFSLARSGDVVFRHVILGATLNEAALKAVVWSVLRVADQYDDRIRQRWGGRRSIDTPRSVRVVRGTASAGVGDDTAQFTSADVEGRRR